jgi:hypothetical protein
VVGHPIHPGHHATRPLSGRNPPLCGGADDIFFDERRQRIYVSCGAGKIAVFEPSASRWTQIASVLTAEGARIALFVLELDRLFVVERGGSVGIGGRHSSLSAISITQSD